MFKQGAFFEVAATIKDKDDTQQAGLRDQMSTTPSIVRRPDVVITVDFTLPKGDDLDSDSDSSEDNIPLSIYLKIYFLQCILR